MLFYYIIFINIIFSITINIPQDYPTIQAGVNAANNGDLIRIAEGIYFENILVEKNITIASQYVNSDGGFGTNLSDYRDNTIIDGSILARPELSNGTIDINIYGLTIRNGNGTSILFNLPDQEEGGLSTIEKQCGGGVLIYGGNTVKIRFNRFQSNGSPLLNNGGALFLTTTEDWDFNDRNYSQVGNPSNRELFIISDNIFDDNFATLGKTAYFYGYNNLSVDASNGFFDVYNCETDFITPYWISANGNVNFDYTNSDGEICSITNDIWVSPEGDNSNSGTSSGSAFQTLTYAMSVVAQVPNNPTTIHLGGGIYTTCSDNQVECWDGTCANSFSDCPDGDGGSGDECVDTDNGAVDSYGDDCSGYTTYPSWCGNYDTADFNSGEMCCACGGGSTGGGDECVDIQINGQDWYDSGGSLESGVGTCDWYGITANGVDFCADYGDSFENFGYTANEACCACGGGSTGNNNNDDICTSTFTVSGSEPGFDDCYSDGSAYFLLEWDGECLATNLTYSEGTYDISEYNFTVGFIVSEFDPGAFETFTITFEGGGTATDSATSNCQEQSTTGGSGGTCESCVSDWSNYGSECCDSAWDEFGVDCATLELNYGWDCSGCLCPGDGNGSTTGGTTGGGSCADGTVDDCSGDGDCCQESWIGDGYCDGQDQQFGCNLLCYSNDGGDCDGTRVNNERLSRVINTVNHSNSRFHHATNLIDSDFTLNPLPLIESTERNLRNSNLESYPIVMLDWVNIEGAGVGLTILDGTNKHGIIDAVGVNNSTISNLTITNGKRYDGGGMTLYDSNINITNIEITNCSSCPIVGTDSGGIWGGDNCGQGGGVYMEYSAPTFNNVSINNNTAKEDANLDNDCSGGGGGGGIYAYMSNPTFINSTISNNLSNFRGGGVGLRNSSATFNNVDIIDNEVNAYLCNGVFFSDTGGSAIGVYINTDDAFQQETILIQNSNILGNIAPVSTFYISLGGGQYNPIPNNEFWSPPKLIIENSTIASNQSICKSIFSGPYIEMTNVDLYNNASGAIQEDWVGAFEIQDRAIFNNITFVNNYLDDGTIFSTLRNPLYEDIWGTSIDLFVTNSIFYDNTSTFEGNIMAVPTIQWNGGGEIYSLAHNYIINNSLIDSRNLCQEEGLSSCTQNINHNNIDATLYLNNSIDENPLFVNPTNAGYNLLAESPCIDTGISSFNWEGEAIINLSSQDYNGIAPDMGANESDYNIGCSLIGDANGDDILNVLDIVLLINIILDNGAYDICLDLNNDEILNILDVVNLINLVLNN